MRDKATRSAATFFIIAAGTIICPGMLRSQSNRSVTAERKAFPLRPQNNVPYPCILRKRAVDCHHWFLHLYLKFMHSTEWGEETDAGYPPINEIHGCRRNLTGVVNRIPPPSRHRAIRTNSAFVPTSVHRIISGNPLNFSLHHLAVDVAQPLGWNPCKHRA